MKALDKLVGCAEIGILAGTLSLLNPQESGAEQSKPSISGSVGAYALSGDVVDIGRMVLGGRIDIDYGKEAVGFNGGLGFYGRFGNQRGEFSTLSGRLREGERERSSLVKFNAGGRIGKDRLNHLWIGGSVVEANNIFEFTDSGFFRQEFGQFVDTETLLGPSAGFSLGGKINKNLGVFLKGYFDYLVNNSFDERVYGLDFSLGISYKF